MIGFIGALEVEVKGLIDRLTDKQKFTFGGMDFYSGKIFNKDVCVVKCGVGKVLSAAACQAMIMKFNPSLIINTGVAGSLSKDLKVLDIALGASVVQHDMDTTAIGEPLGYLCGVNRVFIDADKKFLNLLGECVTESGINLKTGVIASGDKFIATKEDKERIVKNFGAISCEMEGGSIGHVSAINNVPFVVLRAISDNADGEAPMSFPEFCAAAALNTLKVLLKFIERV